MAKLSISKAWDGTREVLRRDGRLMAIVALALIVLPGTISDMMTPPRRPAQLPEPGAWSIVWVVAMLVAIAGQLALVRLAMGTSLTVGQAIGHGVRRTPIYFTGQLLWVLPFAIGFYVLLPHIQPPQPRPEAALLFLLCFAIFLFLAVRMLLTAPVASAERAGPMAMLARSWELTSGSWWRLFAFIILFLLGAGLLVLTTAWIFGLIAEAVLGGTERFSVGALLVSLAIQLVEAGATVVLMVMLARIYLQLTSRTVERSVPTSGT